MCLDDGAEIVALGRDRFDRDRLTRRAARNVIAEVGESVNRLPDRFVDAHDQVPWAAIRGMRNRIVHAYQQTDHDVVWSTLTVDLPFLRSSMAGVLDEP